MHLSPPLETTHRWRDLFIGSVGTLFAGLAVHLTSHWVGDNLPLPVLFILPILYVSWRVRLEIAAIHVFFSMLVLGFSIKEFMPSVASTIIVLTVQATIFSITAYLIATLRKSLMREQYMARVDPLTGVPNARAFEEVAAKELAKLQRNPAPVSIIYFDLDHFKRINDTFGHHGGDRALRLIGDALRHTVRGADTAARIGGDEFVVLLPNTARDGARAVVTRLQSLIAHLSNNTITCSIGCMTYTQFPPKETDDMLKKVDAVMYMAKENGRNSAACACDAIPRIDFIDGDVQGTPIPVELKTKKDLVDPFTRAGIDDALQLPRPRGE